MIRERFTGGPEPRKPVRRCRQCGCTDDRACPGGCWWVEADLCSACADLTEDQAVGSLARALEAVLSPRSLPPKSLPPKLSDKRSPGAPGKGGGK